MAINSDKPHLWKKDIKASVDIFNHWFMMFAPLAYRESRITTTRQVEDCIRRTSDLTIITAEVLRSHPGILPALRMATCPPLARDRLIGLAGVRRNLIAAMEDRNSLPSRMVLEELSLDLGKIAEIVRRMLDQDIFPWISANVTPTDEERHRAGTIVADRLCGAVSDPIIRNAQEQRQLTLNLHL